MPNLITQFRRHYASRPGICQYVDWETTVDIKAFFPPPAWKLLFQFTDKYFDTNRCKSYLLVLWLKWSLSWRLLLALNDLSLSCIFFRMAAFAFSENRVIYVLLICQTSWSTLVVSAVTFNSVYLLLFFIGDHSLMLCMPFSIIYKNIKYDWGFWVALSVYFDFLLSGFLCLWERKTLIWSSQPG